MNKLTRARISASMSKERPLIRKAIVRLGVRPHPDNAAFCVDTSGKVVLMSRGWRKQLDRMIVEGYFESFAPPEASNLDDEL